MIEILPVIFFCIVKAAFCIIAIGVILTLLILLFDGIYSYISYSYYKHFKRRGHTYHEHCISVSDGIPCPIACKFQKRKNV